MARSQLVDDELWRRGVKPIIARRGTEHGSGLGRWRWVVEWTFSWIEKNKRMSKDYERLCASGEALVYAVMSRLMVRRLTRL
jgi:transposase